MSKYSYGWKKGPKVDHPFKFMPSIVQVPDIVDLEPQCPPVYDQQNLGSCSSHAASGLAQFLMMKLGLGNYVPSRLAIYWWNRLQEGTTSEDSGATLHDAINSLVRFGVPNENLWEYDITKFAEKPPKPVWSDGYWHIIQNGLQVNQDLNDMQSCLAQGRPFIGGFTVYESFESDEVATTGIVPMPKPGEEELGGHAVCFTKDMKVSLLDGRELSFEDLIKEYENKEFWVYSCDENGDIKPGKAHSPRKTGEQQKILKITLDDNSEIKCTENHPFMLRNGSYKSAKDLIENESLMPLYRKKSTGKEMSGYDMFLNPRTQRWNYTHRMVASANGRYEGVVHHKDFNKLNNNPENLEIMTWEEHTKIHKESIQKLNEYAKSPEGRQKSRELMTKLWNDPIWKEKTLKQNKENGKTTCAKLKKENKCGFQAMDKEKLSEICRENGKKNAKKFHTPESRKKRQESRKKKYETDEQFRNQVKETAKKNLYAWNNTDSEEKRKFFIKRTFNRYHKDKYESFEAYLKDKNIIYETTNHKVKSIEFYGYEDVYDITVDKYHNFALSNGIFVHNCAIGYSNETKMFKIRNSWSSSWGLGGYCWMPYQYWLDENLSSDFWTAETYERFGKK